MCKWIVQCLYSCYSKNSQYYSCCVLFFFLSGIIYIYIYIYICNKKKKNQHAFNPSQLLLNYKHKSVSCTTGELADCSTKGLAGVTYFVTPPSLQCVCVWDRDSSWTTQHLSQLTNIHGVLDTLHNCTMGSSYWKPCDHIPTYFITSVLVFSVSTKSICLKLINKVSMPTSPTTFRSCPNWIRLIHYATPSKQTLILD